jgi:hypothetical protein
LSVTELGFVVGKYTDVVLGLGDAAGAASGVGFAGTPAAGLVAVQGGGGAGPANWFEHAVETQRSTAMIEKLLIGELLGWSGRARAY